MKRQVRRAQTINPFGVGAILDLAGESFVAADIWRWKGQGDKIREPRLERALGMECFHMAPADRGSFWNDTSSWSGVPFYRFPQWLFCRTCRTMSRWSISKETGDVPVCERCIRKPPLVPMRFVMACPRGHLGDVDWARWAHSRPFGQRREESDNAEPIRKCESPELEFLTKSGGSGLDFVSIRCRVCGTERTLEGIASPDSMRPLGVHCTGRQPWQGIEDARPCDAVPQVVQRGATNLTFANVVSSIDIPPFSNWATFSDMSLLIANEKEYPIILSDPSGQVGEMLMQKIAARLAIDVTMVRRCVDADLAGIPGGETPEGDRGNMERLYEEEYRAFLAPDAVGDPRDRFIKRFVDLDPYLQEASRSRDAFGDVVAMAGSRLGEVAQAIRLREVRALTGFSRLAPAEGDADEGETPGRFSIYDSPRKIAAVTVPSYLGPEKRSERWLSGIEVFGEGIFLTLDDHQVTSWERSREVIRRIGPLVKRHSASRTTMRPPTARFVLLHTLAHLLIRRLSFECGYTIASLRERIYAQSADEGEPMAGILIYTAAGDSEGTLGGLVREGGAARLLPTIIKALQDAEWCSSDPLCRESDGQGFNAMNLAACHACALVPETSCTFANRMLDRVLLLGTPDSPEIGFFGDVLQRITGAL